MTSPIGGFGSMPGPSGPKRLGLDIAGERSLTALQQPTNRGPSFAETLARALSELSSAPDAAPSSIDRFVRGEPVQLHQVAAACEEAQMSLQTLVELRNKLIDAYTTVMNMG